MTTLQATDRQEIWEPRWLVEVATSSYFEPRLFSTEDLQATTGFYHGRLMSHPTVERNFTDTFWGMTEVSRVMVQLDNADNAIDAIYTGDPRGKSLVLRRYDRQAGTVSVDFTGTIDDAVWSPGVIELSAVSPDLSIFEQVIPKGIVDIATFPHAIDTGMPVLQVVGSVSHIHLHYVCDDVVNDVYDYLVGYGNLTVTAVYRVVNAEHGSQHVLDGSFHLADPLTEYTVLYGAYGNFTIVRFYHRQVDYNNSFYTIAGDVTGFTAEKNFARQIRTILSDPLYGLGQSVNAASFVAAEAALDTVGSLTCEGVFASRPAIDSLRDLMMIRGMRLDMNAAGEWIITVDTEQTVEKLLIQDGEGDGERTLLGIRNRRRPSIENMISNYILRFQPAGERQALEVRRVVNATGKVERIIENPYIQNTTTADKAIHYLASREKFGAETVEVDVGQEGRSLSPGDLVRLTYAPMGYNASTMEVRRVRKGIDRVTLLLGAWSSSFYTYAAGTLPSGPAELTQANNPRSMKALTEPQVFTGLSAMGRDTTCLIVDESDNEVSWLVKQGSDVHWGECNFLGTVTDALTSKFVGENPTSMSVCWDANGKMQIVADSGTGTVRWAKLSKDGFVEQAFTNLVSPPGAQTYRRPAVAFDRTAGVTRSVHVVYHEDVAFPFSDRVRRIRMTPTGGSQLEDTMVTFSDSADTIQHDAMVIAVEPGSPPRTHLLRLTNNPNVVSGQGPGYTRTDGTTILSLAPSRLFTLPAGIARIIPISLMCDSESLLHVLAVDGSTEGVLMYGRLSNEGKILVPMTPFAKGIYGQGAMHYSQWHVFAPLLGATTLNLLRIEAIPIHLNVTEGLFVGVGL